MLCGLLFLAKPFVASFLPHFLSLDCCLATFSQKFCLLSGRVKRHSLHSLLSHLAHTVASTVELFNSTGFLTHIMIFLGNNYFHACSFSIFIFKSLYFNSHLSSTLSQSVLLSHRYQHQALPSWYLAGWCPAPRPSPPTPHPAPRPSSLLVRERCCVFGSAKLASELSSEAGLWPLRFPRPGAWGCASRENRVEPVAFATLTQVGRVSLSARVSSSSPGSLSRALTCNSLRARLYFLSWWQQPVGKSWGYPRSPQRGWVHLAPSRSTGHAASRWL